MVAFPNQPVVPCDVLEQAGQEGFIPTEVCMEIPDLIQSVCMCQPIETKLPFAPTYVKWFGWF